MAFGWAGKKAHFFVIPSGQAIGVAFEFTGIAFGHKSLEMSLQLCQ